MRERLDLLLDPGTPFLELSTLAANSAYGGEVHGAGQVSRHRHRRRAAKSIIHADDPSIKGGAWYPLSVKKIVRALDIAIENRLPVIHLCDSAGGFLQLQSELFPDRYMAGRIFRNQCILSKMGVPADRRGAGPLHCRRRLHPGAVATTASSCAATAAVFLGGPPLVKAATGEVVTAEALGGADMHTSVSGTCDYPGRRRAEAIAIARDIVAQTDADRRSGHRPRRAPEDAALRPGRALRHHPRRHRKTGFDMREVIARMVDGSRFHEYQPQYGTTLVCGFARIWGCKVGILANNGVLFNDSSLKARALHASCATATARRWSSCRTSPATWSAANTRSAASPRTAPR